MSPRVLRSDARTVLEIAQGARRRQAAAAGADAFPFPWRWDRSRYPQLWLCSRPSEEAVQQQILAQLARAGIRAFPQDAGAKQLRGRAIAALRARGMSAVDAAAVLRGHTGVQSAVSDIAGTLPGGRSLYLEVKQPEWLEWVEHSASVRQFRAAGAARPDQLQFLSDMHTQGALVGVVWSTDDVAALLATAHTQTGAT